MRKSVVCLSLLGALLGASSHASGDPLTLNSLSIFTIDVEDHSFRFAGDAFDFQQRSPFSGFFVPFTTEGNFCFPPCRTGDVIGGTLRTDGEVDLNRGRGVIGDVTFPSLTFRGSLAFTVGPAVLAEPPRTLFQLALPFQFSGVFRAFDSDVEVFAHALRGQGKLIENFVQNDDNSLSPREDPINFRFESPSAQTPEPSTILLVAGGAFVLVRRRYQQTRRS